MLKVCLDDSSMRLGVPFIAPRQLGAVGGILRRQFLPSVGWRTGQSGAPPDIPCSLSGADRLPKLAQPTVEDLEPLAHWTLGVDIELAWLVMARLVIARYCNEPTRLGSLY
jgi:hypothetical protein